MQSLASHFQLCDLVMLIYKLDTRDESAELDSLIYIKGLQPIGWENGRKWSRGRARPLLPSWICRKNRKGVLLMIWLVRRSGRAELWGRLWSTWSPWGASARARVLGAPGCRSLSTVAASPRGSGCLQHRRARAVSWTPRGWSLPLQSCLRDRRGAWTAGV